MQYIKTIALLFFGLLGLYFSPPLQAQTTTDALNLFQRDSSIARRSILDNPTGGAVLLLEEASIQQLIQEQASSLTLVIPDEMDGELTLVLKKRQLYAEGFRAISSDNPTSTIPVEDLHYIGFVQDEPSSRVALSITSKEVSGLIQLASKTIALRRLREDTEGSHVIYNYESHPTVPELDCSATDDMEGYQVEKLGRTDGTTIGAPVCVSVRVEVDQDFKGDAIGLMNQVAAIYEKIGVNMTIAEIYYWNTPSPYTGTTKEIINKLKAELTKSSTTTGDLTVLLSGKGNGGRASAVGMLCDPSAVCYSGQNDDVYTVAHEIGHLLAAHHTHACKWNGNNTALDGCGYNAGYGGCEGSDPVNGGTIMSYCHVRSVGVNLDFHPQVAQMIYTFIKDHSDCTCAAEEFEEEFEVDGVTENIVASICETTIKNTQTCSIDLYTMSGGAKGSLMLTIPANTSKTSPIVANVTYGLYDNGLLVQEFTGKCGDAMSVAACGEEELDFEEEIELEDNSGSNIIANICEVTIINPQSCTVDIYAMTGDIKGTLMKTIPPNMTLKSPAVNNATYGLYTNGLLIQKFNGACGATLSVSSCGVAGPKVKGKVMLEGFYDSYADQMHQNLLTQNLLSKSNPYLKAPWNYQGISSVPTLPANAVDWILVMSRDAAGQVLGQAVGFVSTTGTLLDIQGAEGIPLENSSGNYLSIHHRGHMAVMSSKPYQAGAAYDFTSQVSTVQGNAQLKLLNTTYTLHAGDFDANGIINNQDYNIWVSKSSLIGQYIPSDGDGNGVINNKDYNLWIANRSKIAHMPLHY